MGDVIILLYQKIKTVIKKCSFSGMLSVQFELVLENSLVYEECS